MKPPQQTQPKVPAPPIHQTSIPQIPNMSSVLSIPRVQVAYLNISSNTSIVNRLINVGFLNELWPIVIGLMNLKTILEIRLVSKTIQTLTNKDLSEKAAVKFDSPNQTNSQQDKFLFAKTVNAEIQVNINLNYLRNLISHSCQSISEDKLKLKLKIETCNEINQLMQLDFSALCFNQIQTLDLSALNIDNNNNNDIIKIITKISENTKNWSSLKQLHLGIINSNVLFQLPPQSDWVSDLSIVRIQYGSICDLSGTLNNFKAIEINSLETNASLILPTHLDELEKLTLGSSILGKDLQYDRHNSYGINLALPESLNALKKCTIGNMLKGSTLKLPYSLKNIEILEIGKLDFQSELIFENFENKLLLTGKNDFSLPPTILGNLVSLAITAENSNIILTDCDNLEKLTINDRPASIIWPKKLDNLKNLALNFWPTKNPPICLPSLENLRHLCIGKQSFFKKVQFQNSLKKLESLTIDYIDHDLPNSVLGFLGYVVGFTSLQEKPKVDLNKFEALTSLTINQIKKDTILDLSSFDNVKKLHIEYTSENVTLALPKSLELLHINWISKNLTLNASTLNKLKKCTIGTIHSHVTFELPSSMNNLEIFSLQFIWNGATLSIPSSFSKKTIFDIARVDKYATLDLAFFLANETKSYLRDIWKKDTLSYSMGSTSSSGYSTSDNTAGADCGGYDVGDGGGGGGCGGGGCGGD